MVMALAHCGVREALSLLIDLSKRSFKHTMVLTAVGDALVQLGRTTEHDSRPLVSVLGQDSDWRLSDGALRATAMLQSRFDPETCASIVESVRFETGGRTAVLDGGGMCWMVRAHRRGICRVVLGEWPWRYSGGR